MPTIIAAAALLLLFAAAAFGWLLVFRARWGQFIAITGVAGGALLALGGALVVAHYLNTAPLGTVIVAAIVIGILGAIAAIRTPHALRRPSRRTVALWCPALLGSVVWLVTVGLAQFVPGASKFGWVMNGDSLNNLYYGRQIASVGIALGAQSNPVPLTAAILSLGIGAGSQPDVSAGAALRHELAALTMVWVILLAVVCVVVGVICAALIDPKHTRKIVVVSALGSLLPLTWFASGLIIQWGYLNVSVILPIALASWLTFLASRRHSAAALAVLTVMATLALATWTPIAAIPVALGVVVVARSYRTLFALRGWRLALLIICFAQVLAFVGVELLPTLTDQGVALANPGAGFPDLWWAMPIVVVLLIVGLLVARSQTALPIVSGTVALLAGAVVASGVIVFAAAGSGWFEAYYPKKLGWILIDIILVIALSFAVAAIAPRVGVTTLAMPVVLALVVATFLPPGTWPEMVQRQPVVRILADHVRHDGEGTVDTILRLSTSEHKTLLWESGDPDEPIINEWIVLPVGGFVAGNLKLMQRIRLPYFFYRESGRYSDAPIKGLCITLDDLGAGSTVITANTKLASQLSIACPQFPTRVVIETDLKGHLPSQEGQMWETDGIE
jgi:hypothetical protein